MPCRDYQSEYDDAVRQKQHDIAARLACDRCKSIEASGGEVPEWAREWWITHKRLDQARIRADAAAQRDAELRKRAIAKLTPEERAAIGV